MKARLPSERAALRAAFAWVDPEGDPDAKASYKFIHHQVTESGSVGAANIAGCRAGIAVLNGGRGGADIPDADRQGVWAHLARHIRDSGAEPPDLRALVTAVERRSCRAAELRVARDSGGPVLVGHAAVFDVPSEPMGFFVRYIERIAPGAFSRSLRERADVRALWNHDPNYVLGRVSAGTLRLAEDSVGLHVEIDPPETTWARDLVTSIERGDISQMSFSFQSVTEEWQHNEGEVLDVRIQKDIDLLDVSPVTFPAYPQTDIGARCIGNVLVGRLAEAYARARAGTCQPEDIEMLRATRRDLAEVAGPTWAETLDVMRRRLQLAEIDD